MKFSNLFKTAAIALCLISCSNNDNPTPETVPSESKTISNLNVSAYDKWTYVNLRTGEIKQYEDTSEWIYTDGTTTPAKTSQDIDMEWHIAFHRYEVRTNEGEVLNTRQKDMSKITTLPKGEYVKDEQITDKEKEHPIITDMKDMMDGKVGYAKEAVINRPLCKWVTKKPTGSMPPFVYETSKDVYVLKSKDGSWSKLQFTVAGNTETSKSGYVTFSYEYFPAN